MHRSKSTLDILRTNVVNGIEDDRLLYLLRIKIIRKLESIMVGKVFVNIVVVTARRPFSGNYSIDQLKRTFDIDKSIGIRTFKKSIANFYNIIKDYSDKITEYKNGVRTREEYLEKLKYLERCYKKSKKFKKVEGYISSNVFNKSVGEDVVIVNRGNSSRSMAEICRGGKINIALSNVNNLLRHSLSQYDKDKQHRVFSRTLDDFMVEYLPEYERPTYIDALLPRATMAVPAVVCFGAIPIFNHSAHHDITSICRHALHVGNEHIPWSKSNGLLIINREDVDSIDKEPWWDIERTKTVYPKFLNKELEMPKVDIFRKVEDNTLSICSLNTLTKTDLSNLSKIINIKKLGNKKPYLEMNKKFNRKAR